MNRLSEFPIFSFSGILSLLLISCFPHSPSDKMKNTRVHWEQYFIASLDLSKKQLALGTDSMLVTFENRSDYKMDSAYILFQNQGLF
ncbi:MAG TPA: hypothetical protein VFJ43_07180, partial [Bacteroidia bacterium]|nr:hypothetical protein [Bacteroidia bacterium]